MIVYLFGHNNIVDVIGISCGKYNLRCVKHIENIGGITLSTIIFIIQMFYFFLLNRRPKSL